MDSFYHYDILLFYKGVPQEIDEISIMDGCNFWQMTIKILFPILKPIMVTNVVITAIDAGRIANVNLFYNSSKTYYCRYDSRCCERIR